MTYIIAEPCVDVKDTACVEVCPTGARIFGDLKVADSPVNDFINNNQVQVLKPESGNAPMCFYKGLDKDVT